MKKDAKYTRRIILLFSLVSLISFQACEEVKESDSPPVNLSLPSITGNPTVGEKLTATNGTWKGKPAPVFSYQWSHSDTEIAGATSNEYTTTSDDKNTTLTIAVTAQNPLGSSTVHSLPTASIAQLYTTFINITLPTITGTNEVGQTLTASPGTWSRRIKSTNYQWLRNADEISGSTTQTYTIVPDDSDSFLSVRVTAVSAEDPIDATANATAVQNAVVRNAAGYPVNSVLPVISGQPFVGQTLFASQGTWSNNPVSFVYKWFKGTTPIDGSGGNQFTLTGTNANETVQVEVRAFNSSGFVKVTSTPTAIIQNPVALSIQTVPVISKVLNPANPNDDANEFIFGDTLTASNGTWNGNPQPDSHTYVWLYNSTELQNSASPNYIILRSDISRQISVKVIARNPIGSVAESNSAAITDIKGPPTFTSASSIRILGTLGVGTTLEAIPGTIQSNPAPTLNYVWQADKTAVGTNSATYTIATTDQGKKISVVIAATNEFGAATDQTADTDPIP